MHMHTHTCTHTTYIALNALHDFSLSLVFLLHNSCGCDAELEVDGALGVVHCIVPVLKRKHKVVRHVPLYIAEFHRTPEGEKEETKRN